MEFYLSKWVREVEPSAREFREAVHTVIFAIKLSDILRDKMVMKGGMLMSIKYGSPRFTKDLDFSTELKKVDLPISVLEEELKKRLLQSSAMLNYKTDCRLQSLKESPRNKPDATFPSYEISIGYAERQTPKHRRLMQGLSPSVVTIDYSLNEPTYFTEEIDEGQVEGLLIYAKVDLISEKIRSLLQQVPRRRTRRQDVYDIVLLLEQGQGLSLKEKEQVLESLLKKCESRGIAVDIDSLDDERVRALAEREYRTLVDEVEGDLPDFDLIYEKLLTFYRSLNW